MKRENSIFLAASAAALIVNFLFLHDAAYRIPFSSVFILLAAAFVIGIYADVKKFSKDTKILLLKSGGLVFVTLGMIYAVCIFRQEFFGDTKVLFIWTCILAVILGCIILVFAYTDKEITENTVFLILLAGICVRVTYVVLMQVNVYQNDPGIFAPEYQGHLGYIYHIYSQGTLPDTDPRNFFQAYHPPLHHALAALWMRMNDLFGKNTEGMDELLQSLTLFYSGATLGFINKVGIKLKISCKGRCIAMGFISFLPFGVMMAGAVNNDGLMLLFDVMAIYYTLKWFEEPVMKNILLMALTIGCAMMSKLSGGLIAPAVAVVMLMKVWKDRARLKQYAVQFFCFALAVFPLGLWYPVRNLIQYGMPITYVLRLSPSLAQYIGDYGVMQRLFDTGGQFYPLYVGLDNTTAGIAYNIPVSIVKFLMFGEADYYLHNSVTEHLGTWTFYFTMVILVLAIIGMIIWLCGRKTELHARLLVLFSVLVIMVSYFKFCFDYPHVCSMHVRYIMLPIYLFFLGLGGFFSEREERSGMALAGKVFGGLAMLYILLSTLLLFNLQTIFSM